jgi:hypothetical protein
MIEPHRNASGLEIDGDAVADNYCPWVVDFETMAADKFHRERLKRRPVVEYVEDLFEVIGCHVVIIPQLNP